MAKKNEVINEVIEETTVEGATEPNIMIVDSEEKKTFGQRIKDLGGACKKHGKKIAFAAGATAGAVGAVIVGSLISRRSGDDDGYVDVGEVEFGDVGDTEE